ALPKRLMN
ncbi:ribonuclease HII family protein, partial [Vibrio parahaemolyticus V-223/04]